MIRTFAIGTLVVALICSGSARLPAQDAVKADWPTYLYEDGKEVYDVVNRITWLADFNLPATERFGLPLCDPLVAQPAEPCVNASGTMSYTSAEAWVAGMNKANYLGNNDWLLPTTPKRESNCTEFGPLKNSFGFHCDASAMGYLYYDALGIKAPNTAVPIPRNTVGPFSNFQPSLYWSRSLGDPMTGGIAVFSFANGAQGGSTKSDYLYVLPMIEGELPGNSIPSGNNKLHVNSGGKTVYDPETIITWLADANLAATETFGLPRCEAPATPTLCVALDGSMNYQAAQQFIANMNAYDDGKGYLGQTNWNLPTVDRSCPTYGCGGDLNPMGNLYYEQLKFSAGTPIVEAPDIAVGPFHHVQPSQYWSCLGLTIQNVCESKGVGPGEAEFGFSFGDGFLGTTGQPADHFVTVYFRGCDLPDQKKCSGTPPE